MSPPVVLTACVFIGVVLLMIGEARGEARLSALSKPFASLAFTGLAVSLGALDSVYGQAVVAAFVLSLFGDIALLSKAPAAFKGGLGAFFLAHLAFLAGFVGLGPSLPVTLGTAAGMAVLAVLTLRWLWPNVSADMRPPIVLYVVVVSAMVASAAGTLDPVLGVAAFAFAVSDVSVARDRFIKRVFTNRLWGLPLYYGAQVVFAWSVATRAG